MEVEDVGGTLPPDATAECPAGYLILKAGRNGLPPAHIRIQVPPRAGKMENFEKMRLEFREKKGYNFERTLSEFPQETTHFA